MEAREIAGFFYRYLCEWERRYMKLYIRGVLVCVCADVFMWVPCKRPPLCKCTRDLLFLSIFSVNRRNTHDPPMIIFFVVKGMWHTGREDEILHRLGKHRLRPWSA